ncbi:MAG: M56 family metallopeptidase [Gammaproteobacteria bacterium]|nr:M56 family metallopeptidase [Gammaproteobacteria bacterium]MBU2069782.1 M56 family metallopeptidase [Gammaproteobacteria bacterium]MBU2184647.1 M56 family metallopeptidase [Gammaproteobacteria bacterium]MBU2205687.1 M56 family metallopeptidase [Gammaproteobacteria bacterium]
MTEFLLQLSLPLSLLLLLVLLAQKVLLKPLGARSVYALWAAVPVFLLTTMLVSFSPVAIHSDVIKRYQVGLQQVSSAVSTTHWMFWLWMLGVALCSSYLLLNYLSNRVQYLRAVPLKLTPSLLNCRQANDNSGPYITGFLVPRILLPHDFFTRFDATQQQLILQHELTHWRRGDLHLNYLALAIVSLFWFNPLLWLSYRKYRQAQELACDAVVTDNASQAERIAYGYALLSITPPSSVNWWPLTHHYGDFNIMKQRVIQLQSQRGFSKLPVVTMLTVVMLFSVLLQQPSTAKESGGVGLTPVLQIQPRYPVDAARQSIAGYVQIEFDIELDGSVSNTEIIDSYPPEVFDAEALRAFKKWRYKPSTAVLKGNRVQLDFELDQEPEGIDRHTVKAPKQGQG